MSSKSRHQSMKFKNQPWPRDPRDMKSRLIFSHFKENFEKITRDFIFHISWTAKLKPAVKNFCIDKKQVNLRQFVGYKLKSNTENQCCQTKINDDTVIWGRLLLKCKEKSSQCLVSPDINLWSSKINHDHEILETWNHV